MTVRKIVLTGLLTATLTGGKFALSTLPNVEIVTLLTAVYGYAFGGIGVTAAVLFCTIEPLLYGFGVWWVVPYFLYWPGVALVFWMLGRRAEGRVWLLTLTAVGMTALFGGLTTLGQLLLFGRMPADFAASFVALYAAGIPFYAVQIACNAVLFATVFLPLSRTAKKLRA